MKEANKKDFVSDDFIWDINKNEINTKKHGISFAEARTVFFDENAIYLADDKHSFDEERFIILGISEKTKLLVVCHCYRENEKFTRIISAREAEKREKELYIRGGESL